MKLPDANICSVRDADLDIRPGGFVTKSAVASVVFVALLAGGACSRQPAPSSAGAQAVPSASVQGAAPAPAAGPGGPTAVETVTGEVVETMDASTYTYLRVKTAKGDVWAATGKTTLSVGDKVAVPLE